MIKELFEMAIDFELVIICTEKSASSYRQRYCNQIRYHIYLISDSFFRIRCIQFARYLII